MNKEFSIDHAKNLDSNDPLAYLREQFNIPQFKGQDAIYFTGNSLGLQHKNFDKYLNVELEDWRNKGVDGHFDAKTPWFSYHKSLAKDTAKLVGAKENEIVSMNGLSVNLHLLLTSFYQPNKTKFKILCEPNLFPSDLYILQSQVELRGLDPSEALIFLPTNSDGVVNEYELYASIEKHAHELALIFIGGVNYYTGQVFDLKKIVAHGHKYNIIVGFDLAHAAGNINLELHKWNVDFASWCSYKYLNSGPGNVSSIFIHEKQIEHKPFRLSAWWGHEESTRFLIKDKFNPIPTAEGWQLSNAPIFGLSIYRQSLELFNQVGMQELINKRNQLTGYLKDSILDLNKYSSTLRFKIITPFDTECKGAQLSILLNERGKEVYHYLTSKGVYVDWRDPNVIRVAPVPLYNSFEDIAKFYKILIGCI